MEKVFCGVVAVDEMQFDSMSERGTIDAVFVLQNLQD